MHKSWAKRTLNKVAKNWWDRPEIDDNTFNGRGLGWDATSFWKKKEDKREIVTPEMDSWDKSDLNRFHDRAFNRDKEHMANQYNVDIDELDKAYDAFPKYFKYNMTNMYKHRPDIREIKHSGGVNQWQMNMIEKLDDFYMKGVTYDSSAKAGIMTSELMKQLVILAAQRGQDPEEMMQEMGGGGAGDPNADPGDGEGDGQGKGDGNGSGGAGENDGVSEQDQQKLDDLLKEAIANAEKAIEEIDDLSSMGLGEDSGIGGGGSGAGKQDSELTLAQAEQLLAMKQLLGVVDIPRQGLEAFVKEVIKKGKSYFSSKFTTLEEEFFESDSDELLNIEELMPVFQKLNLEDIVSEERTYHMKFDFYIDISGSMGSSVRVGEEIVQALTLAKLAALKMISMGLIDEYYVFNTQIKKVNSKAELIKISNSGGTSITTVIKTIEKKGRPAIIITDASDGIGMHTDMAYFLTIAGGQVGGRGYYDTNSPGVLDSGKPADKFYANKQVSAFENGKFAVPRNRNEHSKFIQGI